MSKVIILDSSNSEPFVPIKRPAGDMTATQLREHQGNRNVWSNQIAMGFKSFWRGNTTRVAKVEKPASNKAALPAHLRAPALVRRTSASKRIITNHYVAPSKHATVLHAVAAGETTSRHRHKI